jgi:molybdenum cofactor synthesis domain-containing protein
MTWTATVLTISDRCSAGTQADVSGDLIATRLTALGLRVGERRVVPDDIEAIRGATRALIIDADLLVSTGGTGLMERDLTPQAVLPLVDYEIPGFGEAMRAAGLRRTANAVLSRQFAAVIERRLVVCLPGSEGAVADCLDALGGTLVHAVEHLRRTTATGDVADSAP